MSGIFFNIAVSQGGPAQLVISAANFTDLNTQYPFGPTGVGLLAYVSNPEGTPWLPGSIGGTYYGKGMYEWDGSDWVESNDLIEEQLQDSITAIASKLDSVVGGTNITVDITDPNNPIINATGGGSVYGTNLNRFTAAAEVNTSAPHTNWVNRINVNTSSLEAGDYELILSYGYNHNATNSDFESRLSFDGTILGDVFGNGTTHKQEPKDSSGSGGSSGSSQQFAFTKVFELNGLTTGVKPIVFDFRSDDSSDLSTTWDVYIKLIRVS